MSKQKIKNRDPKRNKNKRGKRTPTRKVRDRAIAKSGAEPAENPEPPAPPKRVTRKLDKEEALALQLMNKRGDEAKLKRRLIELERKNAELVEENLILSQRLEDAENRALAREYGFPEGEYSWGRDSHGVYSITYAEELAQASDDGDEDGDGDTPLEPGEPEGDPDEGADDAQDGPGEEPAEPLSEAQKAPAEAKA